MSGQLPMMHDLSRYAPYPCSIVDLVLSLDAMAKDGHSGYLQNIGMDLDRLQRRVNLELEDMQLREQFRQKCMENNSDCSKDELDSISRRHDDIYTNIRHGWTEDYARLYTTKELKDFAKKIWGPRDVFTKDLEPERQSRYAKAIQ